MKIVLRIFNVLIMAISIAATAFLFMPPAFSFNSNIALDIKTFSEFVPETKYTSDIDMVKLLGTDEIQVGISFALDVQGISKVMGGDKEVVNSDIIEKNLDDILGILHEPIDLITDYSIRSIIKSTIREEITKQVDEAREKAHSTSSTEDIMDEAGIDDAYFTNFSNALYDSANEDNATVDSVTSVLYEQIDEAMSRAEEFGGGDISNSGYSNDTKEQVQENLVSILDSLKLIDDSGHIKKISQISYIYLAEYLHQELQSKVDDPASINQQPGESSPDYADRLLKKYVLVQMPEVFYQIVSYISLGLFIGLFVFAFLWVFLFVYTLIKTFSKKPWTMFGPWFWIVGILQPVLGLTLTVVGKFVFPKAFSFASASLPIKSAVFAPRTYALIPSILFIACFAIAIAYFVLKVIAKKQAKERGE